MNKHIILMAIVIIIAPTLFLLTACTSDSESERKTQWANLIRSNVPQCNKPTDNAAIKCFDDFEADLNRAVAVNNAGGAQ